MKDLCSQNFRILLLENTQGADEPLYIILNILPFDINIKWDNISYYIQEGISFTAVHMTDWVYIVVIYVFPVSDWKSEIFEYWGIFRCCAS